MNFETEHTSLFMQQNLKAFLTYQLLSKYKKDDIVYSIAITIQMNFRIGSSQNLDFGNGSKAPINEPIKTGLKRTNFM